MARKSSFAPSLLHEASRTEKLCVLLPLWLMHLLSILKFKLLISTCHCEAVFAEAISCSKVCCSLNTRLLRRCGTLLAMTTINFRIGTYFNYSPYAPFAPVGAVLLRFLSPGAAGNPKGRNEREPAFEQDCVG